MATSSDLHDQAAELAEIVGKHALERGLTVATAESLTSGQIAVHLGAAPRSGSWFSGGVVAYTVEAKQHALDVAPGPVITPECATAMATGAARLLGADCAVGVTGVGGPDRQEDQPVGTVFIAVHTSKGTTCEELHLDADPQEILGATTLQALKLLDDGVVAVGSRS